MKILVSILLLTFVSCAGPRKFTAPSTAAVHTKIGETRNHIKAAGNEAKEAKTSIAKARGLAKGNEPLVLELDRANEQIDQLTKELLQAEASLSDAELKLKESDKKNLEFAKNANRAIDEKDVAVKRYRVLKFPLCALFATLVIFVLLKFRVALLALGWIGIGILFAAPVAAFTLAWFAIDKLIDKFI